MNRTRHKGETTTVELNAIVVKLAKFYAVEHDLTLRRVFEDAVIEYVKTRTGIERVPYMKQMLADVFRMLKSEAGSRKA